MRVTRKHPPTFSDEAAQAMCRPEGTVVFGYTSEQLFDKSAGAGVLLEVVVDSLVFRLWRDDHLQLHFLHASPGTGTRIATLSLAGFDSRPKIGVALVWSANETRLHVLDPENGNEMGSATGEESATGVRVGAEGGLYEVGSPGIEVMGARVFQGGQQVLDPTAIDIWAETERAAQVLLTGSSSEGFIFEAVQANAILVMASTGFEAYGQRRFVELDAEGVRPDVSRLTQKFFSSRDRDRDVPKTFAQDAAAEGVSFAAKLANDRIDFGNYETSRKAFVAGYGIRFGVELGVSNDLLATVKRTIAFRHRIVHVSPLIAFLNQPDSPPDDPIFSNKELAESTLSAFDRFIRALHQATLALDRSD
jgi:hypothetical protein